MIVSFQLKNNLLFMALQKYDVLHMIGKTFMKIYIKKCFIQTKNVCNRNIILSLIVAQ